MINLSRTDNSLFGQWWWIVDRVMLFAFLILMGVGILMAMAATPMAANRIGLDEFYFLKKHLLYIVPSLFVIFFVSILDNSHIKKFALLLFAISFLLTILTIFFGSEIKGAKRWISMFGFSIQPSEFVKPALIIITAWFLSEQRNTPEFHGKFLSSVFFLLFVFILLLQPDIGMIVTTAGIWFGQFFLNGFPIFLAIVFLALGVLCFFGAYFFLPHVTSRVDRFLDPLTGDHYQINRSLEAFSNGGLFGVGPGEGIIKKHIPDAHSDFVFAVLGEEFGFFLCVLVVFLIMFIVTYGMFKSLKGGNLFSMLASVGLLAQFGLQSFVNIASALHMIPTKGMPLPFISYGGSSMLAVSISVGMILSLGRKKPINYELL